MASAGQTLGSNTTDYIKPHKARNLALVVDGKSPSNFNVIKTYWNTHGRKLA